MKNTLLGGLSSLLLPFGAYSAGAAAGTSYQRTYLSSSVSASAFSLPATSTALSRDLIDLTGAELDIQKAYPVRELVVVDAAVADKAMLHSALKPGVAIVEIDSARAGLPQLISALAEYKNLAAVHIVSHAEAGAILLGNSRITPENIQQEVHAFAALHGAVREGGDLLFYGCDLAANKAGEELLDIISNKTGLDVAASNDLTGNSDLHGDWDLEVKRGNVEAELAFSEKSLKDFSSVLVASDGAKTFTTGDGWAGSYSNTMTVDDFTLTAKGGAVVAIYGGLYAFSPNMSGASDNFFYVQADGTNTTAFELTALHGFEAPAAGSGRASEFTNVRVVGYLQAGGTVTSTAINGTGGEDTFLFDTELVSFSGQKLKGFKILFDCSTACDGVSNDQPAFFSFNSFTIAGAVNTPPAPTVTDARISIAGATGTGGAYKIGDTVTATWNNTAGGDNNSGITGATVDFSEFGGGAAVVASNSSNTWTATYTITAGALDAANRNVSVTATNTGGSDTTADTTNATVDSIAPTVTDGRISISGATGTAGAYKIGDTVTATWNNTAGGDNNTDTISPVTVNFSQFGGGAAVAATNSSGTWTATYTIVAGAIDAANLNISFSATDNAGNATTTADTTNATADNNPPSVSSIAVKGTPATIDSSMEFTVTFDESVSNISTDDFALATTSGAATGTIASVSAASGSSVDVTINSISGNGAFKLNLNGSTNIADDAGNSVAAFTAGSTHTVAIPTAPDAPTIGTATAGDGQVDVTFTAPGNNGGSAITTYTATANPGGAFGTCAGPAACTATVTGLTNGTAYTFTVTATNAIGTSVASGTSNSATPKANQTITFPNPGAQNFGTAPDLSSTASATSSLAVSFSSTTIGVCTITGGGALTFVTAGTCTIDADQVGNSAWNAATTVTQSFTVNAVVPDAPTIGTATAGDEEATVIFTPPANTGGAAIIASGYTVTASPGGATATGSGSPITVTGLTNGVSYTFTVTATNSAGEGAASAPSNSVTPASPQTITFANPGTQSFGTTPTLTASSSAGGGYVVTFTSSTTGVCTITSGGVLTFLTAGTCTINADQAGDGSFLAAPQVSQSFSVSPVVPGAPTIGTAIAGDIQASVAFVAPVNIGGSAITSYTVTVSPPHVAPVAGASSPIVVTGLTNGQAYTFTVTADNVAGTGPASGASNSITPAATQTITFAAPGAQNFGTTPTLIATTDATGLTPTFTSSTTGVCTITSGGALTFISAGTCTINADQAGNGTYLAAPQVTRSFTVNAVVPGAPTIGTATAGNTQATVAFTVPASNGGSPITGYTVTASPGGATATGASSPIAVTGLTNGTAYTFTVTATNVVGTGVASAASAPVTPMGTQTITFANPADQTLGTSPTLSASASSGLTPVFSSATTGVCTITSGGALSLIAVGTCTIEVNQAGNASYQAAPEVSRSFDVEPALPGAPTAATAVASDAGATVTFSAPVNNGGAAITGYTVTASPGGITATGSGSPINVTGLTNGTAYSFRVSATNAAGTGSLSAASNTVTPTGAQTISLVDPGAQVVGGDLTLSATASSGLTPVFASSTPAVCTVTSVGVVTLLAEGTCTLSADQAGNASFDPAPTVSISFNVAPPPNQPPVITQGAQTSVTMSEDGAPTAFALVLTATDSENDPLSWSLTGAAQQGSASVSASGSLSYVPNADYHGSDSFVVQVSDGEDSASITVNVTIEPENDAPAISGTPTTSVDQDAAYNFTPTATDLDEADVLTFSISNKPTWASFNAATGALTGTPTNTDVGTTTGIVISVSDGSVSTALPAFNLTVVNVNEAPVISGTPTTSVDQDTAYSFIPTASDTDAGDVLNFSITNKPTWASFNSATGALTGTPAGADAGISGGIVISVSDGTSSAALPAFAIEVIATVDPLQPIVTAPADIELNATALFTPVSLRQLLSLNPASSQEEVEQTLRGLSSDGVSGNSCCTTNPEGLNADNVLLLPPGRHVVKWKATNAVGVTGETTQVVNIKPLVSLSKSQIAVRGKATEFRVLLNGVSPAYPLTVPFSIDPTTTATAAEYTVGSSSAVFTEQGQLEVTISVALPAVNGFSDSRLVLALGDGINLGANNRHVIDIRQGNVPPSVNLTISQDGVNTSLVAPNGGPVTVSAQVNDANVQDTHSFDWSATSGLADTDGNPADASRSFDAAGLVGGHQVQVTVTDSAGASVSAQVYFRVVASLPVLDINTDTDQDGISDDLEGAGDTDNNGIPNYLDNMPSPNILPQQGNTTNSYLIECDPGVRCGLGLFARGSASGGVQVLDDEVGNLDTLIIDPAFEPVGGIFDFTISDLPTPGQSVRVVIPQQAPIPANAVYRKFKNGAWVTFVSDADNALHSAAGNPGYCPPPGTADWTPGLTAGHLCVQLTLEDGGPNDDDGLVNSAVVDPGAVSEAKAVEPPVKPPVVPKPPVTVKSSGSGSVDGAWILLLGALLMMKIISNKNAKRASVVALVLASAGTQAADTGYLRVEFLQAESSVSANQFRHGLTLAGHEFSLDHYDVKRTGFQLSLGHTWTNHTYSELGYLSLGDVDVDLTLDGDADMLAFKRDFAANYPLTAKGLTWVHGVTLLRDSPVSVALEGGVFMWQDDKESNRAQLTPADESGFAPLATARLDWHVSQGWSLGLNLRRIYLADQEVDTYGVSTSWSF